MLDPPSSRILSMTSETRIELWDISVLRHPRSRMMKKWAKFRGFAHVKPPSFFFSSADIGVLTLISGPRGWCGTAGFRMPANIRCIRPIQAPTIYSIKSRKSNDSCMTSHSSSQQHDLSGWKSGSPIWSKRLGVSTIIIPGTANYQYLRFCQEKYQQIPTSRRLLIAVSGIPGSGSLLSSPRPKNHRLLM